MQLTPGQDEQKEKLMNFEQPYLLFLGDAVDPLAAKVAQGLELGAQSFV
ncbi:hypothetical protein JCM19233_1989 [Vibrio astriarenae]|nr:hypothetical protein JCM19233_1989 [Vibrio sp. C7]